MPSSDTLVDVDVFNQTNMKATIMPTMINAMAAASMYRRAWLTVAPRASIAVRTIFVMKTTYPTSSTLSAPT
jgi:hypothetical protein